MWGIQQRADTIRDSLLATTKSRLVAAASVLTVGFLLLGSLLLNTLWTAIPDQYVEPILANLGRYRTLIDLWTSPFVYWVPIRADFQDAAAGTDSLARCVARGIVDRSALWMGGYVIGLYLGYTFITSIYGATGSLIALLLWAYYSAWIILFGAKFTQVYTDRYGVPIVPYDRWSFAMIRLAANGTSARQRWRGQCPRKRSPSRR
jgi:membrane protein